MKFDTELVIQFLTWFVSAGAGILAYWLLARPIVVSVLAGWAEWTEPNQVVKGRGKARLTSRCRGTPGSDSASRHGRRQVASSLGATPPGGVVSSHSR